MIMDDGDDGGGGGGGNDKQKLDEEVANVGDGVPMPELCSPVFPGNRTETIGFVFLFLKLILRYGRACWWLIKHDKGGWWE